MVSSMVWYLLDVVSIIVARSSCWVGFMDGTPVVSRGKGEVVMETVVIVGDILS